MRWLREIDRVLRGEAVDRESAEGGLRVALGPLLAANVLLAAFYGVCMGVYGLFGRPEPEYRQLAREFRQGPTSFLPYPLRHLPFAVRVQCPGSLPAWNQ